MPSVLITGAGRRIGKGLAIEFARKGWKVLIHYNSSQEEVQELVKYILKNFGVKVEYFPSNLVDIKSAVDTFENFFKEVCIPNVLVNN
ncbi:MAG: SDR family oxidoreductase, partial [Candidatus Kapaibacteriota bacterium]